MPDAGFERMLTAEQFAAWQDFRDQRDDSDLLSEDSTAVEASKQDSDPQFQLATRYLQAHLDESR